ncbi:hypothetical protein DFH07DRAFT_960549 [Mycena maculata]|uniref:Uncharacterized protein n=1 Tax=Mycena maculata TaxID=230809 RepID=A0AAD7IX96_9AGAR|nr:hypothetical protein DFH07DRAFT_960549 [Mycena maculata]
MLSFFILAALALISLAVKPIHLHNDLEPILGIINGTISSITPISVENPLQLLIDFKSDGPTTYQPALDALQTLRTGGHLTTYANGALTQGTMTAVGTGNTPLASVVGAEPRDLFFNADILQLYSTKPGVGLEWGPEITPLASVDYSSVSSTAEMQQLVLNAHDFGIRSWFWDTAATVSTWDISGVGLGERGRLVGYDLKLDTLKMSSIASISTTSSTSTVRPALKRSSTMPAIRRALSLPSVEKSFASLRASSTKGLRRMSTFGRRNSSSASSAASASTESIPVFTTPDYKQPISSCPPPSENISPLTRPTIKRALTMPAPVRALRSTVLAKIPVLKKQAVHEQPSRKSSVVSTETVSSAPSTSTRRRSSSISSVESFTSTEDKVTIALYLRALPSTLLGLFKSLMSVLFIMLLPTMAAEKPKRTLTLRPYQCKIVLTEEQERNPPTAPKPVPRLTKAYRRSFRRAARAKAADTPIGALAALFAPVPERVRAIIPTPVDPKTLTIDVPLVVYSSPIALPLPKGPAPVVRPARQARRFSVLPTVREEKLDAALCPGW